jgi:hypothetical protein
VEVAFGVVLFQQPSPNGQSDMTIRSLTNVRKKKVFLILYSFMAVFIIGVLLGYIHPTLIILCILGFAGVFVTLIYTYYKGIRCPKCDNAWGFLAMQTGGPFSLSKKLKFCPFCGVNLDSNLNGPSNEV